MHAKPLAALAAAAVSIAMLAPAARAQFDTGFEPPDFAGSPEGVPLTGQGGWYRPSGVDFGVYTSGENALGLPGGPAGGAQLAGGRSQGGPQAAARAQRDLDFAAAQQWIITYDTAVRYDGNLPAEPNLSSLQLQPLTSRSFVSLNNFEDPQTAKSWKAQYSVYNADGSPLNNQTPGDAWRNLAINHWYRIATTIDFATNRITRVAIIDLETGALAETAFADWYLGGGAQPDLLTLPDAVRLLVGGSAGGAAGFDNITILPMPAVVPGIIRNVTPVSWLQDPVVWIRDAEPLDDAAPLNGVDFLIDKAQDPVFDIVVNFRRCVTDLDILFLQATSPACVIQRIGSYITYVALGNVTKAEALAIAQHSSVAFIERQVAFELALDISVRAIRVRASPEYPVFNVQTQFPGINGAGVNIAIIDTGVDNTQHLAFAATPFIAGYDAISQTFTDPDDDHHHGTHVASIALGQAWNNGSPGVAPGAGLIDIKVADANGVNWLHVIDGIEQVYNNRIAWNVKVMNICIVQPAPSDGTDVTCQLVDLAEAMDISVAVAAGNLGPHNTYIGAPAAAARVVTVASSDDKNTVNRSDEDISSFSSKGPRANNFNASMIDELKPEVAAPGHAVYAAFFNSTNGNFQSWGTSVAAPHIAGLMALMRQQNPSLNCAMIKCRLIASATQIAGYNPTLPQIDAVWNQFSGWGLVDAYASIAVSAGPDITFPSHPANPSWLSPDISISPPPQVGFPSTITAMIHNPGGPVPGVRIDWGVHNYSPTIPTFFNIGTTIVTLTSGTNFYTIVWTPGVAGHLCLQVDIGSCNDPNGSNNTAARNLGYVSSPIEFELRNTLTTDPMPIDFDIVFADPGWTIEMDPPNPILAGNGCPITMTALPRPPFGAPDGATTRIDIGASIGGVLLGGISIEATMKDCNGNGEDDYFDILNGTSPDANSNGIPDECDCYADCDASGALDLFDFLCFVNDFNANGPYSDCNHDGARDLFDFLCFVNAFNAGC